MDLSPERVEVISRTAARIWSGVMVSFITLFALAHILFPETDPGSGSFTTIDAIAMIFFPIGVTVGMIVSWKWEMEGALITIISVCMFYLLIAIPRGVTFTMFPVMFAIAGSSLMFLGLGLDKRFKKKD